MAHLAAERGLARNTLDAYRRDLRQYLAFLESRGPTPELVEEFIASLNRAGLRPSTVARKVATVRSFHRFLVAEGMAAADPTRLVESARRPGSLPKALDVEETIRLVEAPSATTRLGRRDRAMLEFMYATGARVTETVEIGTGDVDLHERTALVTGKGNRQRLVPLGGAAVAAITIYLPDRAGLVGSRRDPGTLFVNARGGHLTRQGVWTIVRKAARSAGIPVGRVSPHVLRHSAATHMVEGGADLRTVQEMLGHANISTTQVYTRVSPRHLLEVYVQAHPRSS